MSISPPSSNLRSRLRLGALALISLIACAACLAIMVKRIVAFHEESPRVFYQFNRLDTREFVYADRPVSITDEPETGTADAVTVRFGDQTLRIRRTLPPGIDGLPGLQEHADWLRVMRFADASGMSDAEFHQRLGTPELPDRLAIITRSSRPGANPESWGKVWKRDWSFDIYELKADGTIEHERLRYPTATRMKEPKPGELHENTWQFQAAMYLMPQGGNAGPTRNFRNDGLAAAGWTLPVSMFTGLTGVLAIFFAAAPRKRTDSRTSEATQSN